MTTVTVGERFQVVIPKEVRKVVGLAAHSKVGVEAVAGCIVIRPIRDGGWRGIGREMRDGTDPTDYVRKLRLEWSGRP